MNILRTIMMMMFMLLSGAACFDHALGSVQLNTCAAEGATGSKQGPLQTPALVEQGNEYLDGALRNLQRFEVLDVYATLLKSSECFGRALRLAPDSYEALLSMSVAYLARARLASAQTSYRASLLQGARHMLGRAYMLRHGAYEPLYYLAEVAVAEDNLDLAQKFLEPLRVAEVKAGPVNMLLGYISERNNKTNDALQFYRKAVAAGWPAETLSFAAARLAQLQPSSGGM